MNPNFDNERVRLTRTSAIVLAVAAFFVIGTTPGSDANATSFQPPSIRQPPKPKPRPSQLPPKPNATPKLSPTPDPTPRLTPTPREPKA